MRSGSNTFEYSCVAPVCNGRDIHIQQFGCCKRRVASITSLPTRTEPRPFGTIEGNAILATNPIDFAGREPASQSWTQSLFIELIGNARRSLCGGEFTNPSNNLLISAACISHHLGSFNTHFAQSFRLPPDTHFNPLLSFGQRYILDEIP